MGTTRRYCVDCGSRLVYYPNLSNPKAPNEYRVLVYSCMNCSEKKEKPTFIAIKRNQSEDSNHAIKVTIEEQTTIHKNTTHE